MPEQAVAVPWHHWFVTVQPQPQSSHEPRSVKASQREPVPPQWHQPQSQLQSHPQPEHVVPHHPSSDSPHTSDPLQTPVVAQLQPPCPLQVDSVP